MGEIVGVAAALAWTLFAGAAVYVSLVEHPARLSCGTEIAAAEWAPSYKRGTVMQVSLAVLATLGGVSRWLRGAARSGCGERSASSRSSPSPSWSFSQPTTSCLSQAETCGRRRRVPSWKPGVASMPMASLSAFALPLPGSADLK